MTIGHAPPPTAALFLLHLHDFYGIEIETYAEGSSLFTSCNSVPRNSWGHYARLSSTTSERATGTYKQVARALSGPSMACCAAVLALAANRDVVLYASASRYCAHDAALDTVTFDQMRSTVRLSKVTHFRE